MNYSITGPAANVYPECTGVISEGAKWRICETKGKERRRTTVKQTRMSNLSKMELHSYISASINNLMSSLCPTCILIIGAPRASPTHSLYSCIYTEHKK